MDRHHQGRRRREEQLHVRDPESGEVRVRRYLEACYQKIAAHEAHHIEGSRHLEERRNAVDGGRVRVHAHPLAVGPVA